MKTLIGITPSHLKKSTDNLKILLSSEMVLYVKTRKFHWNVRGNNFMELHKLFENQYNELETSIDEIAERIGTLGENATGTLKEFLKLSILKEENKAVSKEQMLKELVLDYETLIVKLRDFIDEAENTCKDAGTADFLTGILKAHEFTAWTLRRYIE